MNLFESFGQVLWNYLLGLSFSWIITLVILVFAGTYIFEKLYNLLISKLKTKALETATDIDDKLYSKFVGIPLWYFFVIIAWGVATIIARTPGAENFGTSIIYRLLSLTALVLAALEASKFVELFLYWLQVTKLKKQPDFFVDETRIGLVVLLLRIGIWLLAFFAGLSVFGLRFEAILGAAGIASLVIALALQSVLADLFSSFLIYLDRPFRVGDLISINNGNKGRIKRIGMKTTRIEAVSGEELIIANSKLLSSEIQNYRRMERRRIEFTLSLDPVTAPLKIKALQKLIRGWFKTHKIELTHDAFTGIKPGALILEGAYTLNNPEYEEYIKINEKLNYFLLESVTTLKIKLK